MPFKLVVTKQPCSSSNLSLSNCSGLEVAAVGSEAILPAELLTTTLLPVNIVTDTVQWRYLIFGRQFPF